MFAVHPPAVRAEVLALVESGVNDCEIARRLGLPRTTVRDIRRPRRRNGVRPRCPRCWRPTRTVVFSSADYVELLGLYLGDGYITTLARTQQLRITLDTKHRAVVSDTDALLRRCFPQNRVGAVPQHEGRAAVLWVYNAHLHCLFPQVGAGKKHERRIVLEQWQQDHVDAAPWAFLRGCIRSDGCVFLNRTGPYTYVSYEFSNLSTDILDLFEDTCVAVGLRVCRYATEIRINRRDEVARLLSRGVTKG